jgi:hypothetical protein
MNVIHSIVRHKTPGKSCVRHADFTILVGCHECGGSNFARFNFCKYFGSRWGVITPVLNGVQLKQERCTVCSLWTLVMHIKVQGVSGAGTAPAQQAGNSPTAGIGPQGDTELYC